jgi:microsomal epoxide hydrolase
MRSSGFFALLLLISPTPLLAAEGRVNTAPGIEIHYREAGPADATHQMLLIPGWRISSSIWAGQMAYFSSHGYRVVAIDSRSQGGSTVVPQGNAPEDRAADIDAVIRSLKLKQVLLVGWSQGAQDVAAYVGRFGTAALLGVVLVDSPVSAGPDDVTLNPGFIKVISGGMGVYARHPAEYTDGMMHAIISTPAPAQTFTDLDTAAALTPVDVGVSMLVQDMFAVDRRPDLQKFDKPTLVIASGQSPLLQNQRDMAKALPHGQFVAVDHAAHAVFFDQPERFEALLEDFVTKLDAAGD